MNKNTSSFPDRVETVVLGATWYGCGLAFAAGRNTLVLERSIVPGREFSLALEPGSLWDAPLASPEAASLREEAVRRNALVQGVMQNAALTPILAQWCLQNELPIRFTCDVLNVSPHAVEFQAVDGLHRVECSRVLSAEPSPRNGKKYLSILIREPNGTTLEPGAERPGFRLFSQCVPDRLLWQLELDAATPWEKARAIMLERWAQRPEALKKWSILFSASEFSFRNDDNPFSALDRGIQEGGR